MNHSQVLIVKVPLSATGWRPSTEALVHGGGIREEKLSGLRMKSTKHRYKTSLK